MKLKKAMNRVIPCFLTLAMVLTSVDVPVIQGVVKAAETSAKGTVSSDETEDVTLGNEALTTSGYSNGWNQEQGLYVSYGQYDGKLTDYRLLQSDGKTAMFDADEILWIDHFEDSADQYNTNWQGTYLQEKINGDFFYNNSNIFSNRERNLIQETNHEARTYAVVNEQGLENPSDYNWEVQDDAATDYVFPLSCYELDHLYSTAEGRIKHGVEFTFSKGVRPIYWTRSNISKLLSMSDDNSIDGVKAVTCWTGYYDFMMKSYCSWSGTEVSDPPEEPFIGVSPAMNVDISNVALTTKKGISHTSQMIDNPVGKSSDRHLVMSLPDGNDDYHATRLDNKIISSEEGGKIQLEVSGETSTSNQITGMIINSDQDIIYFGKIGNVGEGKYEVSIPGGLPVGDYVLKTFSEENVSDNATSYVSNMQDVSFQVRYTLKDVTLNEDTFVRDDTEKGPVVTVKYNDKVLTEGTDYEISGTRSASKISGKEGYTLTVTGIGDYYGQVEKKWWLINPPMDGKITSDPVKAVYDGKNHGIQVKIDPSIDDPSVQYSLDGENFDTEMPVCSNVVVNEDGSIGSYKIYYKVSADDYEDYIGSTTITIEPKKITLVWGVNNLVYNGQKQAPSATAQGLIDGDACDVIVSGMQKDSNQKTGESVYTAAAESLTNKNYILPKENKEEFYIQPKTIDILWENELVYNGKEQKASAKAVGLEEGDEAEIGTESYDIGSGEKVLAVNAGTYEAKAVSISDANYQLPQDCVSDFKIIPKALIDPSVHVTLTGDGISYDEQKDTYVFEWDGKEKTPEVQLTDDQTGEVIVLKRGIDYTISGDQMEDEVGEYTIVLTGKGNYGTGIRSHKRKIVWKIAKAVINPSLVMESWTYGEKASAPKIGLEDNNASVTYTYYLDKECTQETSEADGASVAGGKPSNAGDYYVRAEVAETDCYEEASVTASFRIQKKSILVTPHSGQYKIYGDTVPVIGYQVEGLLDGDNLSGNLSYGKDENAGAYEITKGTLSNKNYNITVQSGVYFQIKPKTLTADMVELYPVNYSYTGEELSPRFAYKDRSVKLEGTGITENDIKITGAVSAADYGAYTVKVNGINNYTGSLKKVWCISLVKDVTVNYDGKAHTIGVQSGEGVTVRFADESGEYNQTTPREQTNPGIYIYKYQMTIDGEQIEGMAVLKIIQRSSVTEISDLSGEYTGEAVKTPTFVTTNERGDNDENVTIEYKKASASDEAYNAEAPKDAGDYIVRITVNADQNHEEAVAVRNFTISSKKVNATVSAQDKVYDGNNEAKMDISVDTGIQNETLIISGIKGIFESKNVGESINVIVDTESAVIEGGEQTTKPENYRIIYPDVVSATIQKKGVLVIAEDMQKHVGMEDPELNWITEGVVTGDVLGKFNVSREAGENPGDYKIVVTLDGEQNQNYSIEFKPGIFQIQPHNWPDNWTTIKAATENEEGKREKNCQYDGCAQKKYDIIPTKNTPEDPVTGQLEKDVEIAADAPIQDATLHNKKIELINDSEIFGEDEKQWILKGESARVWLEITKADMSDISDSDKGSVLAAAQQIMGENPRITYFNIDMFKQISGKQSFQLHETQNMMKIAIKLPEELLNQDTTMLRYYKIIRLHEGKVDIIDGSFDEKLNELSFETNKFSVYALAYQDLPHATAVTVTSDKTTLTKELETAQLSVRIDPDNAAEQKVVWTSSDDSIATVDADGKVTARAKGKVIITAKTENGITGTISLVIDIADLVTSQPATEVPSESPTIQPATEVPSGSPTIQPTTEVPSGSPTIQPTTEVPSGSPTIQPATEVPSGSPTTQPATEMPSESPTTQPANSVDVFQNAPTVVVTKSSVTTVSKTQMEKNALALNAKLKVSQVKRQINICWGKVKGASGYDVYVQYCGQKFTSKSLNQVKKGNATQIVIKKVNGEKLDLKKNYKIYVLAYKMKGNQKIILGKTITAHIVGRKNDKNTNVKGITLEQKNMTLDAGKKAVVHASTILVDSDKEPLSNAHAKELRFASTNKKVAYVSVKGEIKALKKGSCVVYVYARNGYAQKVHITVK